MLKRMKISNYKSLEDIEVELSPLSVLFGPNAAGKSNFVDALQLLSRIATSKFLKEVFDPPYRGKPLESFTFKADGLPGLRSSAHIEFTIEADIELSDQSLQDVRDAQNRFKKMKKEGIASLPSKGNILGDISERKLRYQITIGMRPNDATLYVCEEKLLALNSTWKEKSGKKPIVHISKDEPHYDEVDIDIASSILSLAYFPFSDPHLVAIYHELRRWFFFYLEPRERMRQISQAEQVAHIGPMGEELGAYLKTLKNGESNPSAFDGLIQSLRMLIPSVEGIDVVVNDLSEVEFSLIDNGVSIPSRLLSDGTLRLLGLLTLTRGGGATLIGVEEPENGLHPARIQLIAEYLKTQKQIGNTQFIITTHSPVLLDAIDHDDLFAVTRTRGKTDVSAYTDWGPMEKNAGGIQEQLNRSDYLPVSDRLLRGDFDA